MAILAKGNFGRLRTFGKTSLLLVPVMSLLVTGALAAAETSLPEYQVKALFLVNFTKYVEWPVDSSADASTPFTIGIAGDNDIAPYLQSAVEGKTIAGHPLVIRHVEKNEDLANCQILFISASEKSHLAEILNQVKTSPVLTVGETDQFSQRGGIIGFIKKEGKIRLQIDLNAARAAGLQISSRLLSVADRVTGKP